MQPCRTAISGRAGGREQGPCLPRQPIPISCPPKRHGWFCHHPHSWFHILVKQVVEYGAGVGRFSFSVRLAPCALVQADRKGNGAETISRALHSQRWFSYCETCYACYKILAAWGLCQVFLERTPAGLRPTGRGTPGELGYEACRMAFDAAPRHRKKNARRQLTFT